MDRRKYTIIMGTSFATITVFMVAIAGMVVILPDNVRATNWVDLKHLNQTENGDKIYLHIVDGYVRTEWTCWTDGNVGSAAHKDAYRFWYVDGDGNYHSDPSSGYHYSDCDQRGEDEVTNHDEDADGGVYTCCEVILDYNMQVTETNSDGDPADEKNYASKNGIDVYMTQGTFIDKYLGVSNPLAAYEGVFGTGSLSFQNSCTPPPGWNVAFDSSMNVNFGQIGVLLVRITAPSLVITWPVLITITHECTSDGMSEFTQTTDFYVYDGSES